MTTVVLVDDHPVFRTGLRFLLEELGELLAGRVMIAHSARFDRRVLRDAFERCGDVWGVLTASVNLARAVLARIRPAEGVSLVDAVTAEVGAVSVRVVRLDGNNVLEGRRILDEANHPLVTQVDTMDNAADKAAELAAAGA